METFSALLAICAGHSPGTGEFPAQRPVTRSFDVFFGLRLNKQLSKQSWGWWFETPSRLLRRHRNDSFHQPGKLIVKYTDPFKHGYTLMLWNSFCRKHNELQILQWRHNGHDGVPNHQPHHCLLNRLFLTELIWFGCIDFNYCGNDFLVTLVRTLEEKLEFFVSFCF